MAGWCMRFFMASPMISPYDQVMVWYEYSDNFSYSYSICHHYNQQTRTWGIWSTWMDSTQRVGPRPGDTIVVRFLFIEYSFYFSGLILPSEAVTSARYEYGSKATYLTESNRLPRETPNSNQTQFSYMVIPEDDLPRSRKLWVLINAQGCCGCAADGS